MHFRPSNKLKLKNQRINEPVAEALSGEYGGEQRQIVRRGLKTPVDNRGRWRCTSSFTVPDLLVYTTC